MAPKKGGNYYASRRFQNDSRNARSRGLVGGTNNAGNVTRPTRRGPSGDQPVQHSQPSQPTGSIGAVADAVGGLVSDAASAVLHTAVGAVVGGAGQGVSGAVMGIVSPGIHAVSQSLGQMASDTMVDLFTPPDINILPPPAPYLDEDGVAASVASAVVHNPYPEGGFGQGWNGDETSPDIFMSPNDIMPPAGPMDEYPTTAADVNVLNGVPDLGGGDGDDDKTGGTPDDGMITSGNPNSVVFKFPAGIKFNSKVFKHSCTLRYV